ncbi:hypothetical protein EV383_3869 [Pseudonocardia sediminis]|uniref:Uncharacterized protein n=1 Tax=Pseudonocardia sediminis TaxID=1397368 RepID=A0A4Q7V0L1_PSEST|nr:hypothetical protein [Pseudonocardia sediminis]RZT86964.1 hypothetical protein EV383_3869 [Pseudonocardia sediminis]
MRARRPDPVVVTDLHEPLIAVHRRQIRTRLVMMVVWIIGWIVAGSLWRHGYLATGILLASGPGIWILWWLVMPRRGTGRRSPVPPPRRRELPGPAGDRHSGGDPRQL